MYILRTRSDLYFYDEMQNKMFIKKTDLSKARKVEAMPEEFAQRLRRLRERQGKSRVVLSQLCGLPTNAIQRYERGESKPNIDSLIAIADYFGVTVDYLLGREDEDG